MHLQLGSVCEGILWSDSRPEEEEENEDEVRKMTKIPYLTHCPKCPGGAVIRGEQEHPHDADFAQISSVCSQI